MPTPQDTQRLGQQAAQQLDRWAANAQQLPAGSPQSCAVMVDVIPLQRPIQQMVDVLFSLGYGNGLMHLESDGLALRLQEALNHYLSFGLAKSSGRNIGFEYYLDEYFAELAPYVKADQNALHFLSNHFITATGQLAQLLSPAVNHLEYRGLDVDEVDSVIVKPGRLQLYVISSEGFEPGSDEGGGSIV